MLNSRNGSRVLIHMTTSAFSHSQLSNRGFPQRSSSYSMRVCPTQTAALIKQDRHLWNVPLRRTHVWLPLSLADASLVRTQSFGAAPPNYDSDQIVAAIK